MDGAELKVFEAVARTGSMSRAAAELNTVQSNVTARIKSLEGDLGAVLFERTSRGVTLTPAGRRLLPFAARAARVLADARRAVADDGQPAGALTIGSLETTAALRLSPVLATFAKAHPAVDLTLRTGTTHELIEQVLGHRLEAAFVCGPVQHDSLSTTRFVSEELVVLTAPDIVSFEQFVRRAEVRIVVLRAGCSYRHHLEALLARRGIVGVRHLEFGTLETIVSCVAAGLGITLLPKALIGSVWSERTVRVHALPDNEGVVDTLLVQHRESYTSSALRAFLQVAGASAAASQAAAE